MPLFYKLEYNYDNEAPADAGVYIHLKHVNVPIYRSLTDKEDYDILPEEEKHDFLTGLFNIEGVVEVSSKAYRVWLMKAPIYTWEDVMLPVLQFLQDWYESETLNPLAGSAEPDGGISVGGRGATSALTLDSPSNRRDR